MLLQRVRFLRQVVVLSPAAAAATAAAPCAYASHPDSLILVNPIGMYSIQVRAKHQLELEGIAVFTLVAGDCISVVISCLLTS